MLLLKLLQGFVGLFIPLIPVVPPFLSDIIKWVNLGVGYLASGIDLLAMFIGRVPVVFMGVCFDIILMLNVVYIGIEVVMWTLRKIPFLNLRA